MTDQRITKWTQWIDGAIKRNVLTMHLHRDTWREVSQIIEAHGELPDSYWWEFMLDTYATTQAVAVRRQADIHKDVASLGKLIQEIRDDRSRLTREWWIGLWDSTDPWERQRAAHGWDTEYAGAVGVHLDPAIPTRDLDTLIAAAARVKAHVDEHLAHADASAVSATITVTLKDVHDPVGVIGELFQRYYTLLTAASMVVLVPAIQHDWMAVFREPWIRSDTRI